MSTGQITQGFAPDSVYAEWTEEQREVSNRMEADYNRRRSAILALGDEKAAHTVRGCADDSLVLLAKLTRRDLEDVRDGSLRGGKPRERLLKARLRDIEREQDFRLALAESWLAIDSGTHCYSAFQGRGGLLAVADHGATPPSYDLAVTLDWEHWRKGLPHVLGWDTAA